MSVKKKILFVIPNLGRGGIQSLSSVVSKYLDKLSKYDITAIVFREENNYKFYGEVINLNAPSSENSFIMMKNSLKKIRLINKISKKGNYDLIYASSRIPAFFSLVSKFLFRNKIPLIIAYHNTIVMKNRELGIKAKIATFISRKLSNYADRVHSVSNGIKNELELLGFDKNKLITIHNAVDISVIEKMKNEDIEPELKDIFQNYKVIVTAVRLEPQKNLALLIKAFNRVKDKIKSKLLIVGEGSLREELEGLVNDLKLHNDVRFMGWRRNPFKYIKNSDLFVLSSSWEGFGNIIIEAMACGAPVISTDCPFGPNEIINNGVDGILVPVNDPGRLADEIINVLSNKKLSEKLAKNGKERSKHFEAGNIAKEYAELFDEVLNG